LKIINTVKKMGRAAKGLEPYVKLKVDLFNVVTILRGVKNNIDPKAIEELLIFGEGSIRKDRLKEAVKSGSTQKALAYFESIGLPKADSARDLEKAYEKMMAKNNDRTYYKGYVEIGAVIGYLELKLEEITKLIRIANTVERGIDAKRAIQEFI
jgi:vacuolar-type H+-ATPase subunit C/Vma6